MALQNIGAANSDDAFYRYKMPRMITKIEGRGNGIKTNIVNMVDIAKALARPASYTTKYFGCELGAQSKFDEKTGVSLVNGAHDTSKLAGLLENFIKKYVQCYGCGNPETEIIISKTQMLTLKCAACGYVSDVDMRDKLTTFILKNPPEQKKGSKDKKAMRRAEKERLKEGEAADEELKKLKKESKKKVATTTSIKDGAPSKTTVSKKKSGSDGDGSASPVERQNDKIHNDDDDDDVEWQTDTSLAAAQQRIQEQLNSVTAEMVMLSTNEEPVEENKPEKAKKGHTDGNANGNTMHNESNGAQANSFGINTAEIKSRLKNGITPNQLQTFLGSLKGSPQEVMTAVFEALFDGAGKGFSKEVGKKKNYIAAIVQDEAAQLLLLHAVEAFCGKCSPDAVKEVALVVKVLYDGDILEEDTIIKWHSEGISGGKNSLVFKNVKPFVEWLQSAESEEE
ncbi:eukaryotic translation initiation factor 5-like [Curcuma longa]|uniref:eukaryotic translation initiation factor 5-like n=1 Tax=Curcuma longa TaxID=136217 RepID=UPI003D9F8086